MLKNPSKQALKKLARQAAFNARQETDSIIQLILPYPVSVNALYAPRKGRGVRKSEEYRSYERHCAVVLKDPQIRRISCKYEVTYTVSRPDNRARDIDNLWKAVSDILQINGVIKDDSNCVKYTGQWLPATGGIPCISIEIRKHRGNEHEPAIGIQ